MKNNISVKRNLSLLTDFYQLTMANGYINKGMKDTVAYFDMFFRRIPDGGGFVIMAGVEQLIEYMKNLHFDDDDIEFLRSKGIFSEEFLQYLREFEFSCDVWAVPEGTPIFPYEPIVTVRGPLPQAQLVETMVLLSINHQSLIATKANRIVRAADGRGIMEFGSRRAQGYDGAILGARASYIGGCIGTACTIVEQQYGIPALGTMAHSWVESFDNEFESFKAYAETYPDAAVLLVDTYSVINSGIPNAIRTAKEVLEPMGYRLKGIRIDSGDIAYLTKKVRKMLDDAGLEDCNIVISNSLDEYLIRDLLIQGAKIDSFGVGENLITAKSNPVFGGVYKVAAIEKDGVPMPKIKISENVEKITNPGYKKVYRFFDKDSGKVLGDVIALADETIDETKPYIMFDPVHTWKKTKITNYRVQELQVQIFESGKCVYETPDVKEIKSFCKGQIDTLWDEMLRFENPQTYYVDLSHKLWTLKNEFIHKYGDGRDE